MNTLPPHAQLILAALALALLLIQTARAAYFRGRHQGAQRVASNLAEEINYLRGSLEAEQERNKAQPLTARLECIAPRHDSITPMDAEISTRQEAVRIIHEAQGILSRYLPPDGITEKQAVVELLGVLDSREACALTHHLRA